MKDISQQNKPKPEILLLGGGGHCKSVIDVIEQENRFTIAGIIDNDLDIGSMLLDYKVIGRDDDLKDLKEYYDYALVTVGQIKTPQIRIKLFELLKTLKFTIPVIISPRAYVSKYATVGEGTIVMHDVFINVSVVLGKNCIVNTKALIEHDAIVQDHSHISTGAVVNGGTMVGQGSFIGSQAVTKEGIIIEKNSFIKAGSVVK